MLLRRIGTTSEEIEHHLGMLHQTCSSRRTDLRKHGYTEYYVVDGVEQFRINVSGRRAYVEIATPRGVRVIREGIPLILGNSTRTDDPTASYHKGNAASIEAFNSSNFKQCSRRVLAFMVRFTP